MTDENSKLRKNPQRVAEILSGHLEKIFLHKKENEIIANENTEDEVSLNELKCTELEVGKAIRNLNNSKSKHSNEISTVNIKKVHAHLIKPITASVKNV